LKKMSQNLKITWIRDDTVRVQAVLTDFDGTLLTPTSDAVVFYDPVGTNMGTVTTAQAGTGTYTADYSIPSGGTAGIWKVSWKILSGTWPSREVIHFHVGDA
jgi:uncharacterized protein YfaS (alpha-2-macroglobulin family)